MTKTLDIDLFDESTIDADEDTGKEIPTDTPDELWDLIQQYEKKDIK